MIEGENKIEKKLSTGSIHTKELNVDSFTETRSPSGVESEVESYDSSAYLNLDDEKLDAFLQTIDGDSLKLFLERTGHGLEFLEKSAAELPLEAKYFLDKITSITNQKTLDLIHETVEAHEGDTNFPSDVWSFINEINSGQLAIDCSTEVNFKAKLEAIICHYHSPYPEVRSVTDVFNDPTEPCETIRSYTIAIFWVIIASGIGEFFSHRQPSIALSTSICSVLMYPCGKVWEKIFPDVTFNVFGSKWRLNPGPYSFKEQMFATLLIMSASANVYVSFNIVTQVKFYHHDWVHFGYQFFLVFSTQLMGFSFAGLLRKFVIYPGRAVWPTVLPNLALNRALLKPAVHETINGWTISRYSFFWICFTGMFVYFWIPDYLFQALSTFNWMTWISPNNFNLATITGSIGGMGLNPVPSFDWNVATTVLTPFSYPFMTSLNFFAGTLLGFFIIIGTYWSNYKWTAYLPINSNAIFTNTGESYEVKEVLGADGKFDVEKYQKYSPPFYTAANLILYGAFFMVYPFSFLFNGYKELNTIKYAFGLIWGEMKDGYADFKKNPFKFKSSDEKRKTLLKYSDSHSRKMSVFKETPDSWFLLTLIVSLVFAIITVKKYPETNTPVWGIFFVIGINFVFLIPFTLLYAVSGIQYGMNVLVELIVGYATNDGMALMTLKALGYNIDGQAENFISAQKIAHYAKVPPRALFRAQLIGTIIQGFVFIGVVNWSMSNIKGMCDLHQKQKFSCPNERTYYAASVLWGYIGPKIMFNGIYPAIKYTFLIGFLLALLFIAIMRWTPRYWPKHFEPTVVVTGILNTYAPYNLGYVIPGFYLSFAFMFYIKRHYTAWFAKYTYVFSAAMSSAIALSSVIIFFAVQYHPKNVNWWGNTVSFAGIDGGVGQQALKNITATDRGYFGPEIGFYPTNESV